MWLGLGVAAAGRDSDQGRVVGIDISDEMIRVARETSVDFPNLTFQVASAERFHFLTTSLRTHFRWSRCTTTPT